MGPAPETPPDAWAITWKRYSAAYVLEVFTPEDAIAWSTWLAENGRDEVRVLQVDVELDEGWLTDVRERIRARIQTELRMREWKAALA